ncbi:hypothetical protein [Pseudomonas sp. HS6]|uniref:hypothetical protein n=1 Tax=Pseudomonas sp. HS6 TaxID=2850559 RepID=UPI002018DF3C|nr:hypothetical protein [Pseudomonas sp. HS6]UQS16158.1 hypothetical protein JJN09_04665 [Pseudomonas sp. HS6]
MVHSRISSLTSFVKTTFQSRAANSSRKVIQQAQQERSAPFYIFRRIVFCVAMAMTTLCFAQNSGEQFTRFSNFALGSGTLADIAAIVAPVKIRKTGEAGEFMASICYRTPEGFAAFLAGEMDGPENSLGGFWVSRDEVRGPCALWPADKSPPSLVIGAVHLDMTFSEFKRVVNRPIIWTSNWATVTFESIRKLSPDELARLPPEVSTMLKQGQHQDYMDVIVSISASFSKGHLQQFRIWKTESM